MCIYITTLINMLLAAVDCRAFYTRPCTIQRTSYTHFCNITKRTEDVEGYDSFLSSSHWGLRTRRLQ